MCKKAARLVVNERLKGDDCMNFLQYSTAGKLLCLLLVALFSALVIDTTAKIFAGLFDLGGTFFGGYASLGRYILYLFSGEVTFPDPNFSQLTPLPGELYVGLAMHYFVAVMDTAVFFFVTFVILKSPPRLLVAVVQMWLFLFMPLLIDMPALGLGWAAADSPIQPIILLRTFVCHTSFGIAMFVGLITFDRLYMSGKR